MQRTSDSLLREALRLPETDRARMAGALLDSLDSEGRSDFESASIEESWRQEVRARSEALDAGRAETHDWPTLRARLRAKLSANSSD